MDILGLALTQSRTSNEDFIAGSLIEKQAGGGKDRVTSYIRCHIEGAVDNKWNTFQH